MINGLTNRQWKWIHKIVNEVFWHFRWPDDEFDVRKNGVYQMRKALCNHSVIRYVCTIDEWTNHVEFLIKYHDVPIVVTYDNDDSNPFLWGLETFSEYAKRNLCPDEVARIQRYLR